MLGYSWIALIFFGAALGRARPDLPVTTGYYVQTHTRTRSVVRLRTGSVYIKWPLFWSVLLNAQVMQVCWYINYAGTSPTLST